MKNKNSLNHELNGLTDDTDENGNNNTQKSVKSNNPRKSVIQTNIPQLRFPEFEGEWEKKKLGEVTFKVDKKNKLKELLPIYSINNINGFTPQSEQFDGIDSNERGYDTSLYKIIESKTFAYNPARINVGSIGYSKDLQRVIISSLYVCFKTVESIDDDFFYKYVKTDKFIDYVNKMGEGGVRIYLFYENFSLIPFVYPTLPEQTKIATFLTAVDEKIQALKKKHSLLEQYKKGVMQQLFCLNHGLEGLTDDTDENAHNGTQKSVKSFNPKNLRFRQKDGSDFPEWEVKKLGEVLNKNSAKNKNQKYSLVQSVSNKHGFINQDEMFEDRRVASKNTSNYYVIKKGHFAYNPSRIDVGSLAYKYDDEISVISPLYISFRANQDFLTDNFLLNWFSTEQFQMQMNNSFEGSVRNTLSYESLSKMEISIPVIQEQTLIANFLSALDEKINQTQQQIEKTEAWKKGLLQKMFV